MTERIPALKRDKPSLPASGRARKLLAILIALLAIALIVLFFRSSLSKYSDIRVSGTDVLTAEEVIAAAGVLAGDSFFRPGRAKLAERVKLLKPIESVTITKKFPGVLIIEVREYPEVAVRLDADGTQSRILSNGLVLPGQAGRVPDKPILSGWATDDPNWAALCALLGELPAHMLDDLSEIRPDPSLSYPDRIKLFTRSRFEVLTTVGKLPDRIAYLADIVQNREPGKVMMLDTDTYMPYSAQNAGEKALDDDKVEEKDSTQ